MDKKVLAVIALLATVTSGCGTTTPNLGPQIWARSAHAGSGSTQQREPRLAKPVRGRSERMWAISAYDDSMPKGDAADFSNAIGGTGRGMGLGLMLGGTVLGPIGMLVGLPVGAVIGFFAGGMFGSASIPLP
jgi:hypothetical protein